MSKDEVGRLIARIQRARPGVESGSTYYGPELWTVFVIEDGVKYEFRSEAEYDAGTPARKGPADQEISTHPMLPYSEQ